MRADYESYIRARFAEAKVNEDPFPHLVIRDVLPGDAYNEMQEDCPGNWRAIYAAFKGSGYRKPLYWPQPVIAIRPPDQSTVSLGRFEARWQRQHRPYIDLIDTLTADAFRPYVDRYVDLLLRFGFARERSDLHLGQALFTHRTKGWVLSAHTHASTQMIQSLIYFPLPGATPDQGTVLYRLKRGLSAPGHALFQTYRFAHDDIEPAGMMEYHPNTLASFVNTPLSIHASSEVPGPSRRYTFTAVDMAGVSPTEEEVQLDAFRN